MSDPYRILMICTGNICRSIMAEVIVGAQARERSLNVVVESAGVSAEETGNSIDYRARAELQAAGYKLPSHRAHQATREELENADLILAMTKGHLWELDRLCRRYGVEDPQVLLLRTFDEHCNPTRDLSVEGQDRIADVEDPWYGGPQDFVVTRETIERSAGAILDYAEQQLSK